MLPRVRFLFLIVLAGVLLAACGGSTTGSAQPAESGARVKLNPALGSAPVRASATEAEGPAARGATGPTSDVAGVCLSPAEAELARQINEYRATKGLPAIPVTKSMTLVAQQHAWDSTNNSNAWPAAPAGKECNMHSWSGNVNPALQEGTWTANCYTDDHANMAGMHNKPRQIAGFPGDGYENSHWASSGVTPTGSLTGWKNSPGHNAVITEQNGWGPFLALGVGMNGNYAHMWVAEVADPAGVAPVCGGGAGAEPTTVPAATAPTAEPAATEPTAVPAATEPTAEPAATGPTGEIMSENSTISAGATVNHTFNVVAGQTYTVVVSPSADLDAEPSYSCQMDGGTASGSFDSNWEGGAETFTYSPTSNGSCTVTVGGYGGTTGTYTITANAQ